MSPVSRPSRRPVLLGLADPRAPERLGAVITPFTRFAAASGDYNNGLSTACMILGRMRGGRLVAEHSGCTARFVEKA